MVKMENGLPETNTAEEAGSPEFDTKSSFFQFLTSRP